MATQKTEPKTEQNLFELSSVIEAICLMQEYSFEEVVNSLISSKVDVAEIIEILVAAGASVEDTVSQIYENDKVDLAEIIGALRKNNYNLTEILSALRVANTKEED